MRKLFPLLPLIICCACANEHSMETDIQTSLSVTNSRQYHGEQIKQLGHLILISEKGQTVSQTPADEDYGLFTINTLSNGKSFTIIGFSGNDMPTELKNNSISFGNADIPDLFCWHGSINDSSGESVIPVQLRRTVGALELTSSDKCPVQAKAIELSFGEGAKYDAIHSKSAQGDSHTHQITLNDDDKGETISITQYTFLPAEYGKEFEMPISLQVLDSNDAILSHKEMTAPMAVNHKTQVKIALFDESGEQDTPQEETPTTPGDKEEGGKEEVEEYQMKFKDDIPQLMWWDDITVNNGFAD